MLAGVRPSRRNRGFASLTGDSPMRKTLIATAVCLAIGFALPAMADDTQTGGAGASAQRRSTAIQYSDSSTYTDSSTHSNTTTNTTSGSFNTTNAIASSTLNGTVTGNNITSLGNVSMNLGNANGARGGS